MNRFMTDLAMGAQCTILVNPSVTRRVIWCPIVWACEFAVCAAFSSRGPPTGWWLVSMVSTASSGRHFVNFVFWRGRRRG
jgi:hypothetical protein